MEPELRQNLITVATAFAAARKIEIVTVSRLAAGDWRFFERIESGSSFTARKYDEIIRWFADHWPEDVKWPAGVIIPAPRPSRHKSGRAA